jgi:hypothetical protein
MKLYFIAVHNGDGIVYQLTMSDDYIPLWKKAGIYELLYAPNDGVTCEQMLPKLIQALTDMCIRYVDYRLVIQLSPIETKAKVTDAKLAISFRDDMDELLREQVFRQACATLSILILKAMLYPRSCIRREKEEGHN